MTIDNKSGAETRRFFLRRENRVQQRADFTNTYENGLSVRRRYIHVFIADRIDPSMPTRLGITATRKFGNAAARNRFKRRVRESFRHLLPELIPGHTIVVNALKKASSARYVDLDENLRSALTKAGLIPNATDSIFPGDQQ